MDKVRLAQSQMFILTNLFPTEFFSSVIDLALFPYFTGSERDGGIYWSWCREALSGFSAMDLNQHPLITNLFCCVLSLSTKKLGIVRIDFGIHVQDLAAWIKISNIEPDIFHKAPHVQASRFTKRLLLIAR